MHEIDPNSSNSEGLPLAAVFVGQLPFQLLEFSNLLQELGYKKVLVCESDINIKETDLDKVIVSNLNMISDLTHVIDLIRKKYRVDAVFGLSETNVLPAAYICEQIGAKGTSMRTALICRNKFRMRKVLGENKVPIPRFFGINSHHDLEQLKLGKSDFPLISKPTLGFASQGVRRADDLESLTKDVRSVKREINYVMGKYYQLDDTDNCPRILIESYIDGKEIAVDGIVVDGEPQILLCIDKPDVSSGPYFGDSMHIAPAKLCASEFSKVAHTIERATKAAGIQNGPFHVEIRMTTDDAYLVEIGARIGFPRLVRKSTGLDIVTLSQKVILGISVDIKETKGIFSGNLCVNADKDGIFEGVKNKEEIESIEGVDEFILFVQSGDKVVTPPKSNGYIGFVIASGDSYEKVESALTLARDTMILDISEGMKIG